MKSVNVKLYGGDNQLIETEETVPSQVSDLSDGTELLQKVNDIQTLSVQAVHEIVDDIFYPKVYIYNNLIDCTTSNPATKILEGASYTATITADEVYYTMTGASVEILMGNTDITATAYNNGVISIASVTDDLHINITAERLASPIYGVEWVNDNSNTMTRTDDAISMTYTTDTTTGKITSDFDNVFPYNQMRRTTIDGNTFVYVPSMWIRVKEGNTYTGTNYFDITGVAVSETQGAAQTGYSWYQTKPFYYGAYGASSDGTYLYSVTNATRLNAITRNTARTQAVAVGTGYHQRDLYASTVLMFLWFIEFAVKYSQEIMTGVNNHSLQLTGGTDSIYDETAGANFCVTGYDTVTNQMVWHGIEDFIGNLYEWVDGVTGDYVQGGTQYVSSDYTLYDDYNNGTQMSALAFDSPATETGGNCLTALGWDITNPFLVLPIYGENDNNFSVGFRTYMAKSNNVTARCGAYFSNESDAGLTQYLRNNISSATPSGGCRLMKEVS